MAAKYSTRFTTGRRPLDENIFIVYVYITYNI